jgi:hypothetical protein
MIKIKSYEHYDHFLLEKMMKANYLSKDIEPPDNQKILDTIGFFTSYPHCGKIFIILFNNNAIGYSIVICKWNVQYAKIIYIIDELYISKNFQKYKPEVNFIEYLIKQEKIHSIEIKLDKFKHCWKKTFKFFKFDRDYALLYIKVLEMD